MRRALNSKLSAVAQKPTEEESAGFLDVFEICSFLDKSSEDARLHRALTNVREEPKASVLSAYKICDLAYKILKV